MEIRYKLKTIVIIAMVSCLLLACGLPDYDATDRAIIEENCKYIVDDYFKENLPDATIMSREVMDEYLSNSSINYSITSGVYGTYSVGFSTYHFLLDTNNEKCYTDETSNNITNRIILEVLEDLNIDGAEIESFAYKHQYINVVGYNKADVMSKKDTKVVLPDGVLLLNRDLGQNAQYDYIKGLLKNKNNDEEPFILELVVKVSNIDTSTLEDRYKEWNNVHITIKLPCGELKLYTEQEIEKKNAN